MVHYVWLVLEIQKDDLSLTAAYIHTYIWRSFGLLYSSEPCVTDRCGQMCVCCPSATHYWGVHLQLSERLLKTLVFCFSLGLYFIVLAHHPGGVYLVDKKKNTSHITGKFLYACMFIFMRVCNIYVSLEHKTSLKSLGYICSKNILYGSKLLIFLLCQKSLGY